MRRAQAGVPSDDEILSYTNVPYGVAAKYLGWSDITVRRALQQERAPFGIAAQNPETESWSYNISPGALIAYKNGTMPFYSLKGLVGMISDGVERELDTRIAAVQTAVGKLLGGNNG